MYAKNENLCQGFAKFLEKLVKKAKFMARFLQVSCGKKKENVCKKIKFMARLWQVFSEKKENLCKKNIWLGFGKNENVLQGFCKFPYII